MPVHLGHGPDHKRAAFLLGGREVDQLSVNARSKVKAKLQRATLTRGDGVGGVNESSPTAHPSGSVVRTEGAGDRQMSKVGRT